MNGTNSSFPLGAEGRPDAMSSEEMARQALVAAQRWRENLLSEKCDAMHEMKCVEMTQSCLKWDPDGGADGGGNCSTLPSSEQQGKRHIECYYGDSDDGLGGLPALLLALAIGCAVSTILVNVNSHTCCGRRMGLPLTVMMFLFGFCLFDILKLDFLHLQFVSRIELSMSQWVSSHPHVILFVLLPPLLFEDSASIDYHVFRKSLPSSMLLAGPGVMISSCFSGAFSWSLFNGIAGGTYGWATHMLLGGILSATDPVAVLGVLKSLGAPAKLNLIIGGESLLNDGTAVVVFWIFRDVVADCSEAGFVTVLQRFVVLAVGGVAWGWFAAQLMHLWLKVVHEAVIEITIVVTCVFAVFWMAEEVLGVSGILACVVFGLGTARSSYFCMSADCVKRNHMMWEQMGFAATLVIFTLSGIVARGKIDAMYNRDPLDQSDVLGGKPLSNQEVTQLLALTLVFYVAVFIVRGLTITILFPILRSIGYGVTKKEAIFMTFGGLRGAVSLALALLIDSHPTIDNKTKDFVLIQTAGVVTLSLLINGTLAGYLYGHLNLYRKNHYHDQLIQQAMAMLHDDTMTWISAALYSDEFHSNADFDIVRYLFIDFSKAQLVHDELDGYIAQPVDKAPWRLHDHKPKSRKLHPTRKKYFWKHQHNSEQSEEAEEIVEDIVGSSDPYVEVAIDRHGLLSKRKSTSIIKANLNPVWDSNNKFTYRIDTAESTLYATVFDWDFGPVDDYLGEAKLDLQGLIESTEYPDTAEVQQEVVLTPPTRNFSVEESIVQSFESTRETSRARDSPHDGSIVHALYKAGQETARMTAAAINNSSRQSALIQGSLTLKVTYVPKDPAAVPTGKETAATIGHVHIEILKANDLAASDPPNMHSPNSTLVEKNERDPGDLLSDANRMVRERGRGGSEVSEFDARNALYGVFLQHVLVVFKGAAEAGIIGETSTNELGNAVGAANDAVVEASEKGRLDKGALLVMWEEISSFIAAGSDDILAARVPNLLFAHLQTCAELICMVSKSFQSLSLRSWGTLTEEEAAADDEILKEIHAVKKEAKALLARLHRNWPDTFTTIHSKIAFRVVVDEYRHRVKKGYEMGCMSLKMKNAVENQLERRLVELSNFFFPSTTLILKTLLGLAKTEHSAHPAIRSIYCDLKHQSTLISGGDDAQAENPLANSVKPVETPSFEREDTGSSIRSNGGTKPS